MVPRAQCTLRDHFDRKTCPFCEGMLTKMAAARLLICTFGHFINKAICYPLSSSGSYTHCLRWNGVGPMNAQQNGHYVFVCTCGHYSHM